jgi:hypothetical protein
VNADYPTGLRAERDDGDIIEWRYDPKAYGYRFSKWWIDPYTGKQRVIANLATMHVRNPEKAQVFTSTEMKKWTDGGWKVTPLDTGVSETASKRIVDTLLEAVVKTKLVDDPSRVPYWERAHRKRHQDELERLRGRYGRAEDKAQPTPRQAKLIARWKQQGKDRRIIDYCDREKIDPNRVLSRLKESGRGELPYGDTVPVGDWEGRLVYHGCSQQAANSIMQGIEVPPTGGYFGNAFYVADDAKLAKSNYADVADEEEGGAAVLVFTINPGAHILDLRNEEDSEEWMRLTHHGGDISMPDFHTRMVRQGVDGVYDRSVGGLAVYNPEILDLKGPWQGR